MKTREGSYAVGKFKNWEVGNSRIAMTNKNKKSTLNGTLAVATLKDDFKYEDEIQIQLYGKEIKESFRAPNNGKWNRAELFLTPQSTEVLIKALTEALKELNKKEVLKSHSNQNSQSSKGTGSLCG